MESLLSQWEYETSVSRETPDTLRLTTNASLSSARLLLGGGDSLLRATLVTRSGV